ncbi:MAG: hypothetical protein JXA09_03990 [Anaerolineae bacterium]|nr:hypothetical protein [Anaerolineae bacterium]
MNVNHRPTGRGITGRLILAPQDRDTLDGHRIYRCLYIGAGRVQTVNGQPSNWLIPAEPLQAAVAVFEGAPSYLGHPELFGFGWRQEPSVRNLVGICTDPEWDERERGVAGLLRLYDEDPRSPGAAIGALYDQILEDRAAGKPTPPIGLSAVLWHVSHLDEEIGLHITDEINQVDSVDHVYAAGARGYVCAALSRMAERSAAQLSLSAGGPALGDSLRSQGADIQGGPEMALEQLADPVGAVREPPQPQTIADPSYSEGVPVTSPATAVGEPPQEATLAQISNALTGIAARLDRLEQASAQATERETIADMGNPPRAIRSTTTSLEQIAEATRALLAGVRPERGVRPLSGIRELYTILSGDYEMSGIYQPENVYLANVTSSTMAQIVANVLNKRVMITFAEYPQWWRPIVTVENFASLQQVRWITLGGVGELPTVAEGAAYTELTWDDLGQRDSFVKKGGYLGLTLEAIDKDDTRKIQAAPRALAQAAWLTLSKSVSDIFTSNSGVGPSIYYDDANTRALFHASNGNLGTSALSTSSWESTRIAMRKLTEHNSGERLGALTAPRFLLVPPDLEFTAIQVIATEHMAGSANYNINPEAEGDTHDMRLRAARERVIVVDLWTDANNWAAVADPRLYPSIGLGFRFGETPEIYSVADPRAGLMFSNDVMPVKVRFFYAVGPIDYRGLYKHNVS